MRAILIACQVAREGLGPQYQLRLNQLPENTQNHRLKENQSLSDLGPVIQGWHVSPIVTRDPAWSGLLRYHPKTLLRVQDIVTSPAITSNLRSHTISAVYPFLARP